MIYTSYFANVDKIPNHIFKISIARYSDRFPDIPRYEPLMPSKQLLMFIKRGIYNNYQYTKKFNSYLCGLDADSVVEDLFKLSNGRDVVLLCYETPDQFCHRQLVAKWLIDNYIPCQEYGEPELSSKEWLYKLGFTDEELVNNLCKGCYE